MSFPLPDPQVITPDGKRLDADAVQRNFDKLSQLLDGFRSSGQNSRPIYVTALPTAAVDGQEVYYEADGASGVIWHLRYRAAAVGSYKWEVVGGSPLIAEVTTTEATTSTSYAALATAGPSITVPLAGDYDVRIEARCIINLAGSDAFMSYDIGGTGASDNDAINWRQSDAASGHNIRNHGTRTRRKTALAASTALVSKYKTVASTTANFNSRSMIVMPVRVG